MLRSHTSYTFDALGMDPEFEFRLGEEIECADEFFGKQSDLDDGLYLTDTAFGNIGVDGAGAQIEMRPRPGDPVRLMNNLRGCFKEFAKLEAVYDGDELGFELGIQGDRFPLGAHIHFGFDGSNPGEDGDEEAITQFCEILDWAVGKLLLPLSGRARKQSGYYRLTSFHINEDHGFEYRVLPSAIFANDKALEAILYICWHLGRRFWRGDDGGVDLEENELRGMASWDQLMEMLPTEEHLQALQDLVYKYNTFSRRIFAAWNLYQGSEGEPSPEVRNRGDQAQTEVRNRGDQAQTEVRNRGDQAQTIELGNGITVIFGRDHWNAGCRERLINRLRGTRWAREFPVRFYFFGMAQNGSYGGDNRLSIRANGRFYAPRSRMRGWESVNCESVDCSGGRIAVGLAYNVRDEVLALEQRLETLVDTLRFVVWELKRQARVDASSIPPEIIEAAVRTEAQRSLAEEPSRSPESNPSL